jgi:TM2 domain-containing membrane protein YozV
MKSGPFAFLLWLCGLIGLCGLHRFYVGRPWTGLLWLLTIGLLGVGQLIDLLLLGSMVRQANLLYINRISNRNTNANTNAIAPVFNVTVQAPQQQL